MMRTPILLTGLACVLLATAFAAATEIYVNNQTGDDANPGTPAEPLRTIQAAVDVAEPGDVIHLLPDGATYREMISLIDKTGLTIEGHHCTVSGADPLPSDPAQWEQVGDALHRIRLPRTIEDRHILVVDRRAVTMGRTKYTIGRIGQIEKDEGWEAARQALLAQYPNPTDLQSGQFAWEPIDAESGWLYVKGPLDHLEWSTRTQGVYTFMHTHDITIRDLNVRHVLNDGFNLHGDTQDLALYNVSANECFDNGISPHGACSFTAEDGSFLRNGMAVGNGHLTATRMTRCTIGYSTGQEIMFIGGRHVLEDCTIHAGGPEAIRFIYSKPNPNLPYLMREIQMSGKDADMPPLYVMRSCIVDSADGGTHAFVAVKGANVQIENCTFTNITFDFDPAANVQVITSTADGEPLQSPNAAADPNTEALPDRPPTCADVAYGPHPRNILNLWLAESDEPTPLVIRIHGGGFLAGKPNPPLMLEKYLAAGISIAAITYRFSTDAPYPAQMLDGARAVQFLRANAAKWNLDPTRVAATGGSAGGGISLWLGFHDDLADPASDDAIARQSTRLTCMAVNNAQTSYDPLFIRDNIPGPGWLAKPVWLLFGQAEPVADPSAQLLALFADASPINHLSPDDPPVRLTYLRDDASVGLDELHSIHHPRFGMILKARMDEMGIDCECVFPEPAKETDADVQFLIRHLKADATSP